MKSLFKDQTKKEELLKFLMLIGVLLAYTGYLGLEYGFATGGLVAILTWSFFVLCTPIADAGFLLDFPVRLITGLRMIYSELCVWAIAITTNVLCVLYSADTYENTFLTSLLYKIITMPWPYWSIIVLCAGGTFLSIRFGDEMLDVVSHKDRKFHHKHGFKYRLLAIGTGALLMIWAYYHLIETLGIDIP